MLVNPIRCGVPKTLVIAYVQAADFKCSISSSGRGAETTSFRIIFRKADYTSKCNLLSKHTGGLEDLMWHWW
jgi:hypothetical protein